jgi:23S rRNA (uracil1939-C5)-methyltransferase
MPYERQLTAKREILVDQLRRIAGVEEPPVEDVIPSPSPWNYRNTLQFHLDDRGKLGYLTWGGGQVVPIRECHLPEGALNELWPQLDFEPLPGLARVELRLGADGEALMALEMAGLDLPEFEVDFSLSAVLLSPAGQIVLAGDDYLLMKVLGRLFKVSAGSFFQVNTAQAGEMIRTLLDWLPVNGQITLLDVYCGVGLFSAFFAPRVGRCIGIESSESACADYAVNLDEYSNVELYAGAAEEVLPGLDVRAEIVMVDPPRAGLEIAALDALVAMQPGTIAYVSCDPATLARDAARLMKNGFRLERVRPIDMFPQTYHIESISLFSR